MLTPDEGTHADGEVGGGVDVAETGVVQRRLAEDRPPLQQTRPLNHQRGPHWNRDDAGQNGSTAHRRDGTNVR